MCPPNCRLWTLTAAALAWAGLAVASAVANLAAF